MLVDHQPAIIPSHLLPIVFVGCSANQTYLIVLAIATQSRPREPVGAQFNEELLQESHVCRSLPARFGGVICLKSGECNDLTTTQAHFQITRVHSPRNYRALVVLVYAEQASFASRQ
jgi:hypothetical protein